MKRLENRVAALTGAAAGLGRAIAVRLAAEGAAIEILDRQDASAVCDEIAAAGGTARATLCDVTDEAQIAAATRGIGERHGQIDILLNNAGILSGRSPWHTLSRAEMERFIDVNFLGYFLITKAFYPLIKKNSTGRIINVASRTYFLANPGQMAYVASKGAVMGMTRVLARECGDDGITVNGIMPGMVATPGTTAHSQEEAFNRVMMNQCIKKRVTPEHFAALAAFIASDDAEMITGQVILCDGGGYLH
jgi:NAD(P)-dependent dehydrogenase (short-subunit alcohol dehydrogenase family)